MFLLNESSSDGDEFEYKTKQRTSRWTIASLLAFAPVLLAAIGLFVTRPESLLRIQLLVPQFDIVEKVFHLEAAFHEITNLTAVEEAWEIYNLPGTIKLGNELYLPSAFHQLNCLKYLQTMYMKYADADASISASQRAKDVEHMESRIDYLRQAVMCSGDMTLEPQGGQATQTKRSEREVVHVCRDWDAFAKWQAIKAA